MDKKVRLAHKHFIHTDDPENWGYDYTDGKFKHWVFYGYRNSVREDYVNKLYHLHEDLLAAKTEAHHKQIEVEEAKKHLSGCYTNHKKAPDSSTLEKLRLATNSYHIIRDAWKAQATEVIQLRTKLKNAERKLNRLCEEFPSELLDKNLSSQWKTKKAGLLSDKRFALKWQNIIDIIKDEKAVHHIGNGGYLRLTGYSIRYKAMPTIAETAAHDYMLYYVESQSKEMMDFSIQTFPTLGKAVNGMLISLTQERDIPIDDVIRDFTFKAKFKYF